MASMSAIDVDALLVELSAEAPCGDNLEYDSAYGELERACAGKPEQQFGNTIIPAEEPEWGTVKRQAVALAQRTKDLRVAATLVRALICTDGYLGLCDAVALIRGYVERYWATVHPQLDPDDANDPMLRVNTLVSLCDGDTTIRMLKRAPLVKSRAMGPVNLLDWAVAHGELPAPAGTTSAPSSATIEAAFQDADVGELQATHEAIVAAIEHVERIESEVTSQVGASRAASLSPLVVVLKEAEKILAAQLARRGVRKGGDAEQAAAEAGDPATASAPASAVAAASGEIRTREDVIRALDRICEYYERHEPSSPVPMLLRRAKRLATMSFLDILRELAPDGVAQAEALGGAAADSAAA
jgi:type VI secretion system protein ImpA